MRRAPWQARRDCARAKGVVRAGPVPAANAAPKLALALVLTRPALQSVRGRSGIEAIGE